MSWLVTEVAALALATEVLRIANGGVALEGRLLLPDGASAAAPVPAALIVAGTDTSAAGVEARELAARGVAVLTTSPRGSGGSGGDVLLADFDALAHDALASIDALRARPDVDSLRIALVGMDGGGWIAVLADSLSPHVASMVRLGTPEVPPSANSLWRLVRGMTLDKFEDGTIRSFAALHPRLLDYAVTRAGRPAVLAAIDSTLATRDARRAHKKGWLREWITWARQKNLPPLDAMRVEPWIRDAAFDPYAYTCASATPTFLIYDASDSLVYVAESANRMRDVLDFCSGTTGDVWVVPSPGSAAPAGADSAAAGAHPPEAPPSASDVRDRIARWIREHPRPGK